MILITEAILALAPGSQVSVGEESYDKIKWHDGNPKKITIEQIKEKRAELQAAYDLLEYQRKRKPEYPSIEECVHALLDDNLEELQAKRLAVKKKYPKPVVKEPKPELKDGN
tara:strand:+ start:791 stop:1126 length:336 start_codon:yes stop_codon:yes gene_type:complete